MTTIPAAAATGAIARTPRECSEQLGSLPADAVLLPISSGGLLVSRSHAMFCSVPADSLGELRRTLAGALPPGELDAGLRASLLRHGFGGAPRQARHEPPLVQLQLTNACNLRCAYCCTNSGRPRTSEVTFEQLCQVADEVRITLGPGTRVGMLGGEPLLVPWCLDLAERVVDRELVLTLFTNGVPLTELTVARRLAALVRRGAEVRVSLAGPTRETCDALSGEPRFDAALQGIRELAHHGGESVVDLMLLPEHTGAVATGLGALRSQLPAGTRVALGLLYRSGRELGEHTFPSRAALEDALDAIAFSAGEVIRAAAPSPLAYRRDGCACTLGRDLHVRSDGALFTCFKMEEQVGDLGTMSFTEALRRIQAEPHPACTLPACADCPLATLCGGGCRAENFQYTGDPDRPVCGEWRVRVLAELLAEDRVAALEWPAPHLLAEARERGIAAPERLVSVLPSRHLDES